MDIQCPHIALLRNYGGRRKNQEGGEIRVNVFISKKLLLPTPSTGLLCTSPYENVNTLHSCRYDDARESCFTFVTYIEDKIKRLYEPHMNFNYYMVRELVVCGQNIEKKSY